jgi:hypothetical protein
MRTDHSNRLRTQMHASVGAPWGAGVGLAPEFRRPDGLVASRSHAPFPSPLARFRSTVRSALRALSTTESPQGGNPK